jgi:hypothetical protein
MGVSEFFGWTAAGLTLLTFASSDPRIARCIALAANACFITYAVTGGAAHVLALHVALIPVNLHRLAEIRRQRQAACGA